VIPTISYYIPYDGDVVGSFRSFGTKGGPDYSNISENKMSNNSNDTWVATADGYLHMIVRGAATGAGIQSGYLFINGQEMGSLMTYANQPYGYIFPIKKEDSVHLYQYFEHPSLSIRFIPSIGSEGVFSAVNCISY